MVALCLFFDNRNVTSYRRVDFDGPRAISAQPCYSPEHSRSNAEAVMS